MWVCFVIYGSHDILKVLKIAGFLINYLRTFKLSQVTIDDT